METVYYSKIKIIYEVTQEDSFSCSLAKDQ